MSHLRVFVRGIILVEVAAVIGLLLAGATLEWIEADRQYPGSFFSYRIAHLDSVPAWYIALLLLTAANGVWLLKLAQIEGMFHTPQGGGWGTWGAVLPVNPLKLHAVNLVAIPAIMALFFVVRANLW